MDDLDARKCKCKQFVTGESCNECKAGTWNLKQKNPFGCESKKDIFSKFSVGLWIPIIFLNLNCSNTVNTKHKSLGPN